MAFRIAMVAIALALFGPAAALAQEGAAGAGRYEIAAAPGGGMFFTKGDEDVETDFGNYALGAAFTYNVNRLLGIEGEIGSGIGIKQRMTVNGAVLHNIKSPTTLAYNGNLIVSPVGNDRALAPYVAGGAGGLTLFERDELHAAGLLEDEAFFTMNAGGGLKWYASRYWGVRGDYRFFWVDGKDNAPSFFGLAGERFGHRVYGSFLFTFGQ
jgi:hypothetical protein